jgi:hypothetical protein
VIRERKKVQSRLWRDKGLRAQGFKEEFKRLEI